MCRSDSCCCDGSSGAPLGLAAAVLAGVGVVSAEAALITDVLVVLASAALGTGLVFVGYLAWRVRVLTRPARPARAARVPSARVLAARPVRALPAAAPRAIDPPRPQPVHAARAAGLPVKEDVS